MKNLRKICIAFLLCSLLGSTVSAKTVNYQSYTDSKTGKTVEYFDLGEHTSRTYVTQNAWFSDNKSFVVGTKADMKLFRYDMATNKVEQLFDDMQLVDSSAVVDPSTDTVYAKNNTTGFLFKQSLAQLKAALDDGTTETVYSLTLPSTVIPEGTGGHWHTDGNGVMFWLGRSSSNNAPITESGRQCRTNEGSSDKKFYFIADGVPTSVRNVTIEFDYFDYASEVGNPIFLKYYDVSGSYSTTGLKGIQYTGTDTWKTATIDLVDAKFFNINDINSKGITADSNGDFQIYTTKGKLAMSEIRIYPKEQANNPEWSYSMKFHNNDDPLNETVTKGWVSGGNSMKYFEAPANDATFATVAMFKAGRLCRCATGSDATHYFQVNAINDDSYPAITVEFDYYDDPDASGDKITFKFRNSAGSLYNNDFQTIDYTCTGEWKTAKINITNAGFKAHDGEVGDFRMFADSTKLAISNVRVYPTPIELSNDNIITFEVSSDGLTSSGDLTLERWSPVEHPDPRDSNQYDDGNYPRAIMYNGESVNTTVDVYNVNFPSLSNIGGKAFVYNVPKVDTDDSDWKYWRNSFFFDAPDDFLAGSGAYTEVLIEYYAPEKGGTVNFFVAATNGDITEDSAKCFKYSKTVKKSNDSEWKTLSFLIPKTVIFNNDAWHSGWCNSDSNLKLMPQDLPLYIHKVTVRKYSDYDNMGYALGSWLPHIGSNGDISMVTGEDKQLVIYEANNKQFAAANVYANVTHGIINPKYPNLVLYNHEGNAETEHNRIWVLDRSKDGNDPARRVNVFKQYENLSGETTGEAIGHEDWTPDGEHIVAVKYAKDTNIGKNGIVMMDKDGSNRRYINDDYDYLHANVSPDGKWIVADTEYVSDKTKIVLINVKTGKSYVVAEPLLIKDGDLRQDQVSDAHPAFNLDGTKVTFGMKNPNSGILGVGMVDVSDITKANDGQFGEADGPDDFALAPFAVGFNKDNGKNEVVTYVNNIDGTKRAMSLFAAIYDNNGKLISVNKKKYDSANSENLGVEFNSDADAAKVKAFLWNGDTIEPVTASDMSISMLSAAKVGPNEVVLSWQNNTGKNVVKYEVFRGDTKIGETPFTSFKDTGLTKETEYTYYVRPVYGSSMEADIDELNLDAAICVLGYDTIQKGTRNINFWDNDTDVDADSFTQKKTVDGESCRYAQKVSSGQEVETVDGLKQRTKSGDTNGAFFFGCANDMPSDVLVGIRYYDYSDTSDQPIYLKYKSTTDGTEKVVTLAEKARDSKWKTATVIVNDVNFAANDSNWGGYDIRIEGGYNTAISRVWIVPLDENGNVKAGSEFTYPAVGTKAGIKVTTANDTVSAQLKQTRVDMIENGLKFVFNNSDKTKNGYTESQNVGGKDCRQNTSDSTSMFLFNVDKAIIPEGVTSIDVTVEYYNYNSNGGTIKLYYTATDGTTKSVNIATPDNNSFTADKSWKTKTVSITDAKLNGSLYGGDFYINGNSGTKIASVSVQRKSSPAASAYKFVEWNVNTDATSGLTRIEGGSVGSKYVWVAGTGNDWLKFNVDDTYMPTKSENMAWFEITYLDEGTGTIELYYNSSDMTGGSLRADKKADTTITCTNSGTVKKAIIPVIDANFSNRNGYDFVIKAQNDGVSIKDVKVMGY